MPSTLKRQARAPAPLPASKHTPTPVPVDAVWISAKQLLARYGGRSQMWLHRKLTGDADFPKPTYFGRLMFFKIAELQSYETEAAARGKPDKAQASRAKTEA
jgi:hypothetical protein